MDDHLVHTTPNHHPSKMDVLQKTSLQIIRAAKWLVWLLVSVSFKYSTSSDNLCLPFRIYPYSTIENPVLARANFFSSRHRHLLNLRAIFFG